jgi:hypothetical protein
MSTRRARHARAWPLVVLTAFLVLATTASAAVKPKGIPQFSSWVDSRHGWTSYYPSQEHAQLRATDDGGRTWHLVFTGGNYIFYYLKTSPAAGLVESGGWSGTTLWTRDGGRHWYFTHLFPGTDYRFQEPSLVRAGRGNLLFWHQSADTLYRVEGWPPRGELACEPELTFPQTGGRVACAVPAGEAGMRSVVVGRLSRGAFGAMRSTAVGIVALVEERDGRDPRSSASHVAVYRTADASLLLRPFPDPPALEAGEKLGFLTLAAAWPRLYVTVAVRSSSNVRTGTVLWRSDDGGATWTVALSRGLPQRAALVRGTTRIGSRTWIPGGFVASARRDRRPLLLIRQLGRTRAIALPGSRRCARLAVASSWPQLFADGARAGVTALWWSADGGSSWTRFGRC